MAKQDMRVIKTRRALKQALIELLKRETFEKITISELCEEAFVNRVTFYSHYQDKYELFQDYIDDIKNEIVEETKKEFSFSKMSTEKLIQLYTSIALSVIDKVYTYREVIATFGNQENSMLVYMIDKSAIQYLNRLLETLEKHIRLKYDKDYIIPFIVGGTSRLIYVWIENQGMRNVEDFKSQVKRFLNTVLTGNLLFDIK